MNKHVERFVFGFLYIGLAVAKGAFLVVSVIGGVSLIIYFSDHQQMLLLEKICSCIFPIGLLSLTYLIGKELQEK
jgi:hypothetical protein